MNLKTARLPPGVGKNGGPASASVVDLFCGVGGLAYGFAKAGLRVAAGIDTDESCRYAFEANVGAKFVCKPVEGVSARELSGLYEGRGRRVLIGCAPCQPFSSYGKSRADDPKWSLLRAFGRLVRGTSPHVVSMENVPRLRSHGVFGKFVSGLESGGYRVWHGVVDCSDYGVPQTRRRLVLLASRLGPIGMIGRTRRGGPPTVREAIGDLDPIRAGCASAGDPIHRSRGLSAVNLERISQTPQGGGWKDWDRRLVLSCHRKKSGRSYDDVYGRMSWDRPAPTITTQAVALGSGRFGHPEQDRALSLREAALIQTFPRGYKFSEKPGARIDTVARHIGNAVPVALGKAIGLSIKRHLAGHDGGV